jgi:thioesterase domain-containing protein
MLMPEFEQYLFRAIPITQALGIKIEAIDASRASISAPIALNKNHLNTVFGGSSSMVCIVTAWSLFQHRIISNQLNGQLMIREQEVNYFKPITDDFVCHAYFNEDANWDAFLVTYKNKNKARLGITANIYQDDKLAVEFKGIFVLLSSD